MSRRHRLGRRRRSLDLLFRLETQSHVCHRASQVSTGAVVRRTGSSRAPHCHRQRIEQKSLKSQPSLRCSLTRIQIHWLPSQSDPKEHHPMTTFLPLAHLPAVRRSRQLSQRPLGRSGHYPDDLQQSPPLDGHLRSDHRRYLHPQGTMLEKWASRGLGLVPLLPNLLAPPNL